MLRYEFSFKLQRILIFIYKIQLKIFVKTKLFDFSKYCDVHIKSAKHTTSVFVTSILHIVFDPERSNLEVVIY